MNKIERSSEEKRNYEILVQAAGKEATPLTAIFLQHKVINDEKELEEKIKEVWKRFLSFIISEYAKKMAEIDDFYAIRNRELEKREEAFLDIEDIHDDSQVEGIAFAGIEE